MDAKANAPIIIKRKKVSGGHGHHGGAWKVAYADFVTAMMAFFMLMWLLNATTEQQRKGIADYFSPTVAINRVSGGGDGALGGDSVFTNNTLAQNGRGGVAERRGSQPVDAGEEERQRELAALQEVEEILLGLSGESMVSDEALQHIVTKITDEGLVIEIFDRPGAPLFIDETDAPMPVTEEIGAIIARIFALVNNQIALSAHVSAQPVVRRTNTVWDLTTSRATRMRLLLEAGGLAGARVQRLTGHGDRDLSVPDPLSARNNRIEITLLRSDQ